jgi:hypothetical protein
MRRQGFEGKGSRHAGSLGKDMKHASARMGGALALALFATKAAAQDGVAAPAGVSPEGPAAEAPRAPSPADVPHAASNAPASALDSGAVLLAGKFGGIAPFDGLNPFPKLGLELGYLFGGTQGRIAALLAAEYTAPSATGTQAETFSPDRIPGGGTYSWELRQKELVLQPTFLFRLTGLVPRLTPYAGIGPRLYLLESVVRGHAGGVPFEDTPEHSTKIGFGVPLGAELEFGPGGFFGELLPEWGPLNHTTTGDTHLGGLSLFLGYRAALTLGAGT